jgi:peptidoglycan/LPS O-acetylase OafA/YrhL
MIDACRGLAAVAVVAHHLGFGRSVNLGHYAVIVFFVISGYCISASADSCARKGLGIRQYMWRRVRRIYPPYFFAVVFFLATRLVKSFLGHGEQFPATAAAWVQNFTLTQWLSLVSQPQSWAADNRTLMVAAFWSLNYEEQFYLVVGLMIASGSVFSRRLLPCTLALLGIGVVWNVAFPSTSYGFFIEYWVQFGVGCLLFFRLCRLDDVRSRWLVDAALVALAVASIYMVWFSGSAWVPGKRIVYVEWLAGVAFALLLIAARPLNDAFARSRIGRGLMTLGLITYSLYLVHQFNLRAAYAVSSWLLPGWAPAVAHLAVQIAFFIGLASMFWYCFERPFLNSAPDARRPEHVPSRVAAA